MGGGDLNLKKSWHPSTFSNLEKVWKAEQRHEKEQQKLDQLRKEKEAERERDYLRKLQEDAGLIKKGTERVEWMYAGSSVNNTALNEEYLLGRRKINVSTNSELPSANKATARGIGSGLSETRDMENKLREDPLFTIRQKEKQHMDDLKLKASKRMILTGRSEVIHGQARNRSRSPDRKLSRSPDKYSHYRRPEKGIREELPRKGR